MGSYAFKTIWVNGNEIGIDDILFGKRLPGSEFESSLFSFVQQWCSSNDTFVQKTSGSTGIPKLITLTRQQLIASAKLTEQALELKSGDRALVCLDPNYIAGKMMLVRSFISGMEIIATTPTSNPFLALPSTLELDFVALVPYQLHEIIRSSQAERLNKIKKVIVGGAALNTGDWGKLQTFRSQIYMTYGMTETISHIALQSINGTSASSYFEVLPGIRITKDVRGCLEIKADYLGNKITTNDLVEIKDQSRFKWLGRVDNIINTGGLKVSPEKIEAEVSKILERHNISNRFLVSSIPDVRLGNKIVLLLEGVCDHSFKDIQQELKTALANHEIPKKVYLDIKFMETGNGKVDRLATQNLIKNDEA